MVDYLIIGGGFSGVVTGIILGEKANKKIMLVEKNDRLCKKIPSTGNGRGNLTNTSILQSNYHGDSKFAYDIVSRFPNESLIEFFNDLGVLCVKEENKIFPSSMQASSISDMMRFKLDSLNVLVKLGYGVTSICKKADCYLVNNEIKAKNLIICAGGASSKNFGTDGSIFSLLKSLGIKTTSISPSLVQLKTDIDKIKGLKGVKQNAEVTLKENGKKIISFIGDLLFTEYGISGDTVFKTSAYITNKTNLQATISFIPSVTEKELTDFLIAKATKNYILNKHLPIGVVQNKLGLTLLKNCGINPEEKADRFSAEKLAKHIKNLTLNIKGTLGFDYSQVTHGGVETSQLNDNLKHKTENIYFAGEVLNVDGDCGGYNLQFAYSSARVISESIINEDK